MTTELKPCPFCGGLCLSQGILDSRTRVTVCGCGASLSSLVEPGSDPNEPAWNTRALDAASFRAGLEAAAKLFDDQAELNEDEEWKQQLYEMAIEIRALPTPNERNARFNQEKEEEEE